MTTDVPFKTEHKTLRSMAPLSLVQSITSVLNQSFMGPKSAFRDPERNTSSHL